MRLDLLLAITLAAPIAAAQAPEFTLRYLDLTRQGTASLWTDFDGDGATDLFFGNGQDGHSLYRQVDAGEYARQSVSLASPQLTDGVFADIDGDGDRDLVLGSLSGSVYLERRGGSFQAASIPGITGLSNVRTVEAVDVDRDGRLDVLAGTRNGGPTVLMLNRASGWVPAAGDVVQDRSTTTAVCWADVDDDGDLDLYMTTSGGQPNRAFQNKAGVLTAWDLGIAEDPLDASTSCTWGDADGDGDLDLFVTVANDRRSRLYLNEDAQLSEASELVFPELTADLFNATWGDLDNDGDLDLVTAGRYEPLRAFLGDPGGFREVILESERSETSFNTAVALHDFDGDGDLDIAVAAGDSNVREPNYVLENQLADGRGWVDIRLAGSASNREGIGAAVTVYASSPERAWAMHRTLLAHTSRRTQSDTRLHVGLGDAAIDSIAVRWPTGKRLVYQGGLSGVSVTLTEPSTVDSEVERPSVSGLALDVRPNPTQGPVVAEVTAGLSGPVSVEVFDVRGRRVWHSLRLIAAGERELFQLELGNRAAGVYLVRARRGPTVVSTRITLTRR